MRILIVVVLAALLGGSTLVAPAHAEEATSVAEKIQKGQLEAGKPAWMSGWRSPAEPVQEAGYSMMFGLACCLVVLCGGVWVAKKFGLVKTPQRGSGLRVIERTALSAKTSLCLIESQGKQYLVSVGSERVSLISNVSVGDSLEHEGSFEEFICEPSQSVTAC